MWNLYIIYVSISIYLQIIVIYILYLHLYICLYTRAYIEVPKLESSRSPIPPPVRRPLVMSCMLWILFLWGFPKVRGTFKGVYRGY